MRTRIFNVRLWDAERAVPTQGNVVIYEGHIVAVGDGGSGQPDDGAAQVDGGGATLMPGLVDAHGHLSFPVPGSPRGSDNQPPEETVLATVLNARAMLDAGFTGVIGAGSPKMRAELVVRNEIEAGNFPGPRILASTPTLTVTGGLNDNREMHQDIAPPAIIVDGVDACRRAVRMGFREGVDVVKINISGDDFFPRPAGRTTTMSEAEVAAIAETAHALGLLITCHTRSAEAVKYAVRHGAHIINHADFADEEALNLLEAARDRLFVAPTIGFLRLTQEEGPRFLGQKMVDRMRLDDCMAHNIRVHQALRRRGIRHVIGGDYGVKWMPAGTQARDIALFVEHYGYTPTGALACATRNGALAMRAAHGQDDTPDGLIRVGARADLILVDGDPTRDVAVLQRREAITGVMCRGIFHRNPQPAVHG
ncbi:MULTISPECIES: metal-dependent hydrolase family protein [unclassified Sphingobium]|uniref:metal-dependent hydrolase family protein n=1 Tax=unclassified Sphingobium TaxID=2611147 RepID=UPI000D15AE2E|nr:MULTISPECIES: amidohydrolase family protein [unclassified Sphingobium]MBG6119970.1 imidazolonepropionase-like amidohydrolase [Sphingobium sp. JAI105]PSO11863.1 amidohydrolase [Sphingobium sp. AEW4]TWC99591.1 imidazolonepropionase-like amidohydrolase [Sphingobium sp. AEW010]TWD18972.1 imidazolonepropionase-like amidohydrolase [Sphingobium sp. AEW013]TWD21843.1 imidazolonepropionase-like amidohydrolase [Sphingobium sp. AEW001]